MNVSVSRRHASERAHVDVERGNKSELGHEDAYSEIAAHKCGSSQASLRVESSVQRAYQWDSEGEGARLGAEEECV